MRPERHGVYGGWTNSASVPPPTLTATNITPTAASLTLDRYTGSWSLKRTAPTGDNTCTAGEVDYSHALSSLTGGTAYAYTAYSDSRCTAGNELASETFVTPVSVSNISEAHYGTGPVGKESGNDREAAQEFTTGPNSGGYTLTSITVHIAAKTGTPADFVLTLNVSGNTPGSVLATLSGDTRTPR